MYRLRWFLLGAASLIVIAALAGTLALWNARGFSARERPTAVETWFARIARSAAIPAGARTTVNPVPNTPRTLADARAHWADHCAVCHANDGSGDVIIGKGTYPPAPDMRLPATQRLSDGELFYIIENGVRLTAMPAWGRGSAHDEQESWKLVHFIRHLPQLTDEEKAEMKKLNPKSLDELREEQEEENFLKGEDNHEKSISHHHR
jgi:mono/diheme cytochrome c family protein